MILCIILCVLNKYFTSILLSDQNMICFVLQLFFCDFVVIYKEEINDTYFIKRRRQVIYHAVVTATILMYN